VFASSVRKTITKSGTGFIVAIDAKRFLEIQEGYDLNPRDNDKPNGRRIVLSEA
jgi:hypothetical protein